MASGDSDLINQLRQNDLADDMRRRRHRDVGDHQDRAAAVVRATPGRSNGEGGSIRPLANGLEALALCDAREHARNDEGGEQACSGHGACPTP